MLNITVKLIPPAPTPAIKDVSTTVVPQQPQVPAKRVCDFGISDLKKQLFFAAIKHDRDYK